MFSQTVEYALRAMMYLASTEGAAQTSERIAAETRVPPGYICKVMRDLVRARLVTSFRGPGGGFMLTGTPDKISILDVVSAVDPIRRIHRCPLDNPEHADLCPLHRRLDDALASIESSFRQTTLKEVLDSGAAPVLPGVESAAARPAEPRKKAS
jgi:Rrf2 family protein